MKRMISRGFTTQRVESKENGVIFFCEASAGRKAVRGFTLIETVLYIAFLSLILGGAVFTAYNLTQSSGRGDADAARQEEGNFILRKISFALSSASAVDVPNPDELVVTRYGAAPMMYVRRSGDAVEMKEAGGTFTPLSSGMESTAITFTDIPAAGARPQGVTASLEIGSSTFFMTAYLHL